MIFEADKDSLEGVFAEAAEKFGEHIAETHFGEKYMDWSVSGGELWGGEFTFDFRFAQDYGDDATFQVRILAVQNMEMEEIDGNGCAECARSYGPNFTDPCTEH